MNFSKPLLAMMLAAFSVCGLAAEQATLKTFQPLNFALNGQRAPARLEIRARAFGKQFVLNLGPNGALLDSLTAAQRARISAKDLFLRGTVEGFAGSWVRLNRVDDHISGGFFDGEELYLIDRAGGFKTPQADRIAPEQTILFRFGDLDFPTLVDRGGIAPGGDIEAESEPESETSGYGRFVEHLREVAGLQGNAMFALPMTIVSDVQFTGRHGSSAASVVAGRINFIDGIFSSQLGTGITLLHHEILSDNDVLIATDAAELLVGRFDEQDNLLQPGFRQFMSNGAGSSLPFEGLAHLFTGRDLNGGTVGIAYVGALCNRSFGYGVDQDLNSETTSALVFAHEVGHNFNAPHDGENACTDETFRGIMNPFINGTQQFSDCSLEQMTPEVAGARCLVEVIDSSVVFANGFE